MEQTNNKSKIIVITGGSSGIGKSVADLCTKDGHTVVNLSLNAVDNPPHTYKCDVSNEKQVQQVMQKIGKHYGKIDVLFNNAGYGMSGALELTNTDEARKLMDVNFWGTYYCFKHAMPYLQKGSNIINNVSVCAMFPLPWRGFYGASKAAAEILTYSMKMEIKALGINVGCIHPGEVKTNFTKTRVKSFVTNERYGDRIKNATNKVDGHEGSRMSPEYVAIKIYKQIIAKKPKTMTIIGNKYKALYFLSKIFGNSGVLYFTEKLYGGHKEPKTK